MYSYICVYTYVCSIYNHSTQYYTFSHLLWVVNNISSIGYMIQILLFGCIDTMDNP